MERLNLIFEDKVAVNEFPDFRGLDFPDSLGKLNIYVGDELYTPDTYNLINLVGCFTAQAQAGTVNGISAKEMLDSFEGAEDIKRRTEEDSALNGIWERIRKGEMRVSSESPQIKGHIILAVMDDGITSTSNEIADNNDGFYLMPQEWLAESYNEAGTAIFINRREELAGYYYMGNAYRVYTDVYIVNLEEGFMYEMYSAVVNEPPEEITTNSSGQGSGWGEFEPETAVEQIIKSLGAYDPGPARQNMNGSIQNTDDQPDMDVFSPKDEFLEIIFKDLDNDVFRKTYESLKNGEIVSFGSTGETAKGVQETLIAFGRDITADGNAGNQTFTAIADVLDAFEIEHKDAVDEELYAEMMPCLLAYTDADLAFDMNYDGEMGIDYDEILYMIGCGHMLDGELYRAKTAFDESGFSDSEERAAQCIQTWPYNGQIVSNLYAYESELGFSVNSYDEECASYFEIYTMDHHLAAAIFIGGSGYASAILPAGSYMILEYSGKDWYGEADKFGPTGTNIMTFEDNPDNEYECILEYGYSYTITVNVTEPDPDSTNVGSESFYDWDDIK